MLHAPESTKSAKRTQGTEGTKSTKKHLKHKNTTKEKQKTQISEQKSKIHLKTSKAEKSHLFPVLCLRRKKQKSIYNGIVDPTKKSTSKSTFCSIRKKTSFLKPS